MRRNRKKKLNTGYILTFTLAVLVAPVLINYTYSNWASVAVAGEQLAILSAAVNMPQSSLELLKERFRQQLYPDITEQEPPTVEVAPPQIHTPNVPTQPPQATVPAPNPTMPKIPDKYTAKVVSENFAGVDGGTLLKYGAGFIRNETKQKDETINALMQEPSKLVFDAEDDPQVLIIHTHATESFERYDRDIYDTRNTWRSTDNNSNMVAVGTAFADVLRANGINVIHDTTQHDHPSYQGAYERSAVTIEEYLKEFPSIKVVLDLHRDAMEREEQVIVKPVITVDDKKAAQIMIIAGCDDGTGNIPNWKDNLRFAAEFQDYMEQSYPQLTRPVYFCYRKYNMDLTSGSLLLEFGSNANTLEESIYSATLAGNALSNLIKEHTK